MMPGNQRKIIGSISLALLIAAATPQLFAKNYFRFKDEQGQTILLDQLTPEALNTGYDIINEEGKLIQSVPPAKTIGEMQQERVRIKEEEQREIEEQRQIRRDAELLRLFGSVDDIMRSRDASLLGVTQRHELNDSEQRLLVAVLEELQRRAADYERLGNPIPKKMLDDIEQQQKQIAQRERIRAAIEEDRKNITSRFEHDMIRYKELQAKRLAYRFKNQNESESQKNALMMTCDSIKRCNDMWQLAQVYAQTNASGRLEVVTDTIILTSAPKMDTDVGISFSRLPARNETQIIMEISCASSDAGKQLCESSEPKRILNGFEQFVNKQL